MVYAYKSVPSQKLIVMTGLHDSDGMKCGKVLVVEDIAETNMLCNVLFFDTSKIPVRKNANHEFAFDFNMNHIGYWNYFGTGKYFC